MSNTAPPVKLPTWKGKYVFRSFVTVNMVLLGSDAADPIVRGMHSGDEVTELRQAPFPPFGPQVHGWRRVKGPGLRPTSGLH